MRRIVPIKACEIANAENVYEMTMWRRACGAILCEVLCVEIFHYVKRLHGKFSLCGEISLCG